MVLAHDVQLMERGCWVACWMVGIGIVGGCWGAGGGGVYEWCEGVGWWVLDAAMGDSIFAQPRGLRDDLIPPKYIDIGRIVSSFIVPLFQIFRIDMML